MTLLVLIQPVVFLAVLALVLWHGSRDKAQAAEAAENARQALLSEAERQRAQVDRLLQRIQAPQQAVMEHAAREYGPAPDGRPLSEEEAAVQSDDRVLATIADFEQMERDLQRELGLVPDS
jgi:type II secretory pathway pseudopilin PulG